MTTQANPLSTRQKLGLALTSAGLSQRDAARLLDVHPLTIRRAQQRPEGRAFADAIQPEALSAALRAALEAHFSGRTVVEEAISG
jgi:transposase